MRFSCVLVLPLFACAAQAAEVVVYRSGLRMTVERHDRDDTGFWLYAANGMISRAEAGEIARIEQIPKPGEQPPADVEPEPEPPAAYEPPPMPAGSAQALLNDAARRYGLDPRFLHAVAGQESGYRQNVQSRAGAIGIMQLMPDTARYLGADPYDAAQNVDAGTRYLLELLHRYRNDPRQVELALAAYNAGPTAVRQYGGIPPYRETRHYVRQVIQRYDRALQSR